MSFLIGFCDVVPELVHLKSASCVNFRTVGDAPEPAEPREESIIKVQQHAAAALAKV
jgi:hypothetical protein